MASAQVLSNSSRKQEHLEAGKRRLEEFRKKKAADLAKKSAATGHPRAADSIASEKQALENGLAQACDAATGPSGEVVDNAEETQVKDQEHKRDDVSKLITQKYANYGQQPEKKIGYFGSHIGEGKYLDGSLSDESNANCMDLSQDDSNSYNSSYFGMESAQSNRVTGFPEMSIATNSSQGDSIENLCHEISGSILSENQTESILPDTDFRLSTSDLEQRVHGSVESNNHLSEAKGRSLSSSAADLPSYLSEPVHASETPSTGFIFNVRGPSSHSPLQLAAPEMHPRRSRPSFLDSLDIARDSSMPGFSLYEPRKSESIEVPSNDVAASSLSKKPGQENGTLEPAVKLATSNVHGSFAENAFWGHNIYENSIERKPELHLQKKDEDFAALEQHIEELTQERFSLQRALDGSKALAESLAAENSSLTESYNQQASVIYQLKSEMEMLQEEIKAQLGELESMKIQYANAQLECNAADERARLLASEVIGLEEKALRLRSNELKLEKELEKSNAELNSCKKKLSILEKERQDLQLTIDALQEEKKLLQSKLRKASPRGISADKKDASTSTEDLGVEVATLIYRDSATSISSTSNPEGHDATDFCSSDGDAFLENRPLGFEVSSMIIPPDQMQLIQNIISLISELTAEKADLRQALVTEISTSSKLKDINKELSQKLEVQTQRLELLTAQSMVNENMPARQPIDSRIVQDNVPYADEGDEVVERVLGWIMKLFPANGRKLELSTVFGSNFTLALSTGKVFGPKSCSRK
ncbi:hypothetical protein Nepgr_021624 [Nepenthes gracilis]|uniref:Uncharacterized protein n=1 Tax=Nepenthes gracilis TaxID=150966 RepID=A0AAD3XW81_NEPGR|nr:hypothetical protein Nepgr_021624 [Nepenthes gracilis]